jgi:AraC-like DNA-binding protein
MIRDVELLVRDMRAARQIVRSASLRGFPELAQSVGIDPLAAMRRVGLPRRCLDDPETRISADAVARLLESCASESGVEDFGLRMASTRHLSNLGPLGLVLRQEPTGLQALETLVRYLNLLNTSLVTRIELRSGRVVIAEDVLLDRPGSVRQSIELAVGVMFRVLRDVLGPAWRPRSVGFEHRAPRDASAYRALFGMAVDFEAGFNGIVCDERDLRALLPRTDPAMADWARAYLERSVGAAPQDAAQAVRRLIVALLPGGRCTVEVVAQHLGVDRRTVHRRLQAQGETFSGLMRTVRREFAVRQLLDTDRGGAEVAALLGFSGASAFAHWFRAEFGCSAGRWRRTARAGTTAVGSPDLPIEVPGASTAR